jgi:DNA-binding HxlR family transcriptional regulator
MKPAGASNAHCSIARTMDAVGDRWSLLILREAFYGTQRFDDFEHFLGIAPNILSARLKKLVQAGVLKRVKQKQHRGRFDYVLTEKGRDFFPAYLALKKWGDAWLAEPQGPQVVFTDRVTGAPIEVPVPKSSRGTPLSFEDTEVVAGSGAVPFNRARFRR